MPALNFRNRYADLVRSGEKLQTVRRPRKDGRDPKPGDYLHLFTGMRTKHCHRLGLGFCIGVDPVFIDYGRIRVGDIWLYNDARETFAVADGFKNEMDLRETFEEMHGLPFEGFVIRWRLIQCPECGGPHPAADCDNMG